MLRVRPGVELVRATLDPSRELMTLDFPTLERPRNAISGATGAGNWRASVAAVTNWERTLNLSVTKFSPKARGLSGRNNSKALTHALEGTGAEALPVRERATARSTENAPAPLTMIAISSANASR